MKRTLYSLLLLTALTTLSPAPINDRRAATAPVRERSQAELAREARFNGKIGVVGAVNTKEGRRDDLSRAGQPGAADAVAAASARSEAQAAEALRTASDQVAAKSEGRSFPWLLIAALAGGAFGVSRLLKGWADRAIPTPPHFNR